MKEGNKIIAQIKLHIAAGNANPSPPIKNALGRFGVNIMDFCKAFNTMTAKDEGMVISVVLTVYQDTTFAFITKTSPASVLLKKAAKIAKGSSDPEREKVGSVTRQQVEEISKLEMADLNTSNLDTAYKTVEGMAINMGIAVINN